MRIDESEARVLDGKENSLLSAAENNLSADELGREVCRDLLDAAYLYRIRLSCHCIFRSGSSQILQSQHHRTGPGGWLG
jgi:hypothetical protein